MEYSSTKCEQIVQYGKIGQTGKGKGMMLFILLLTATKLNLTLSYFSELLKDQLERFKLKGMNGADIKVQFHFHNNRACIESNCSEITSNTGNLSKSIVLKIGNNEEKLPSQDLDQETKDDLQEMFKKMSLDSKFSQTLKIENPELVTEKWLKSFLKANKSHLPKNWKNPYMAENVSPHKALNLPYNKSEWKYCFEEFFYCEVVCDTIKKSLKSCKNGIETQVDNSTKPSNKFECPKCFELTRPGELMRHLLDHFVEQLPKCDSYKYLCLHCFSVKKNTLDLLKHQFMVVSVNCVSSFSMTNIKC